MINLITNEGIASLNSNLVGNKKLFIEKAVVLDDDLKISGTAISTVEDALTYDYSDLSTQTNLDDANYLTLSSMLPIEISSDNGTNRFAIDLDFIFNSEDEITSITIKSVAVIASLGTLVNSLINKDYSVGEVVMVTDTSNESQFYLCKSAFTYNQNSSDPPSTDTDHWTPVSVDDEDLIKYDNKFYYVTSDDKKVIYATNYDTGIVINENIEYHYKIRIFTTSPSNLTDGDSVVFRSFSSLDEVEEAGNMMLGFIAQLSESFRLTRNLVSTAG